MPSKFFMPTQPLFEGFSEKEIDLIQNLMTCLNFKKNEFIIRQGDRTTDLYLIEQGEVKIVEAEQDSNYIVIDQLKDGQIFGEVSFVDQQTRSVHVLASQDTSVWKLSKEVLLQSRTPHKILKKLSKNLAVIGLGKLRILNTHYAQNLENNLNQETSRKKLGIYILKCYALIASLLATEYIINLFGFDIKKEDVVSLIWMGVVAIIALYIFLGENISFKKAGLTFKNWPRDLIEGTAVGTAIVTVGFLIFSWIEHYTIQEYFFKVVPKLEWTRWVFLYILHSFLQEFIVRLGFQYPIRFFLNDKKGYLSLLVVSMNTAALHIAWDWVFIISTFFGNLLIGYVYLKRNSVFETTIIHFIAGYFAVIHSKM